MENYYVSHYCKSPWMSLFVYDDGRVKSCCAGQWDWGNLKEKSLHEIIKDPKVIKLKEDIINGVQNSYCDYCAGCEANAGESQRKYFTKFSITEEQLSDPNLFNLSMVDMRWNNLCNLNCAYCDPLWSTSWQKIKGLPMTDLKTNHFSSVLDEVRIRRDNMEAIIMGGGEPLLHQQNVQLLQSLNDDVYIDIMTNLSTNLDHSPVFQELSKKTNVNWCISFENLKDEFEYVRHGAKWERMVKNLNTVSNLPGHSKMLKPTYNLFSATRLIELYKLVNDLDFSIHWQTLLTPPQLCVTMFSKPVRDLCLSHVNKLLESEEFLKYENTGKFNQGKAFFLHLKNELEQPSDSEGIDLKFREWLVDYESKYAPDVRKFYELWPDLNEVIRC